MEDIIHIPIPMVRPTLPSLDFVVVNNVKISSEGHCDGDICKVQVSLKLLITTCRVVKQAEFFVQMTCKIAV